MKIIQTNKLCPKCEQTLSIILQVPYFRRVNKKNAVKNKKSSVLDATGFICTFCDSKWTLDEVLGM